MTIYGEEQHVFVDFGQRSVQILERSSGLQQGLVHVDRMAADEIESLKPKVFQTLLPTSELPVTAANPLGDELQDFVLSVRQHRRPRVDGVHAARAVWLAEQIVSQIRAGVQRSQRSPSRRAA